MTWTAAIDRPGALTRTVAWSLAENANVIGDPVALAARAAVVAERDGIRALTLDEFALAAVCASEDGGGTPTEIAALCDATLNRAARAGRGAFTEATGGHGFGRATGGRPMSTAIAPRLRHVRAAVAVSRGEARGVSRGARAWFHWQTQAVLAKRDPSRFCGPAVVLERWCWGSGWADRATCKLGPRRRPAMQWIGPVGGIDEKKVLMFQDADHNHAARFAAAESLLRWGLAVDAPAAVVAVVSLLVAGVAS